MRRILILLALLIAAPAYAGNLCGGGIICLEQSTSFNHTTAPTATTLTLFTCQSTANGCLVLAVFVYGNATHAINQSMTFYMNQGGTSTIMFGSGSGGQITPQPYTSLNMMVNSIYPPNPLPNSPVESNGNPVIFMSTGSSLSASTSTTMPTGGDPNSSSIDVMVYAQQY